MTTKPNAPEGQKLRDLIAEVAADLSNENPFWTAKLLADALITRGIGIVPAHPVADAGWATADDVIGLINIVTDLAEVDALDKAYPEVLGRLDAMVNHAVASATAAKDARDPLRDIVFRYIDRMNDVAPECGDPADRILGDFARDVNAVLKAERAALSEAREAGDSLAAGDRV